jgi:hypothetical protein
MDEDSSGEEHETRISANKHLIARLQNELTNLKNSSATGLETLRENTMHEVEELRVFIHSVLSEVETV